MSCRRCALVIGASTSLVGVVATMLLVPWSAPSSIHGESYASSQLKGSMCSPVPNGKVEGCDVHFPVEFWRTISFSNKHSKEKGCPRFENCGLVGSSASLSGRQYGALIDQHCPVIRVNRLPTEDYFADFGRQTDLLYGNDYLAKYNVSLLSAPYSHCTVNSSDPKCYPHIDCRGGAPGCPTGGIFFDFINGSTCVPYTASWRKAPMPVGCIAKNLHNFIRRGWLNAEYRGPRTSGGMTAFLAFAPHCEKITLYGFSGKGAADGHGEDYRHSFLKEHALYHQLIRGNITITLLTGSITRGPQELHYWFRRRLAFARWLAKSLRKTHVRIVET